MSRLGQLALLIAALAPGAPAHAAEPPAPPAAQAIAQLGAADLAFIDRLTWGVNESTAAEFQALGRDRWLERQLHPGAKDRLPAAAQAQIAAMPISTQPVTDIATTLTTQQRTANQIQDPELRKAGQQVSGQAMNEIGRQAAARSG